MFATRQAHIVLSVITRLLRYQFPCLITNLLQCKSKYFRTGKNRGVGTLFRNSVLLDWVIDYFKVVITEDRLNNNCINKIFVRQSHDNIYNNNNINNSK